MRKARWRAGGRAWGAPTQPLGYPLAARRLVSGGARSRGRGTTKIGGRGWAAAWRARALENQIPLRDGALPHRLWQRFAHVSALNFIVTATAALGEPGFAALILTGTKQLTAVAVLAVGTSTIAR